MGAIILNGNTYHLRGNVQPYPVEQYGQAIITGSPARVNETKLRKLIFKQWYKWGIGWHTGDPLTGRAIGGAARDATVDTRFPVLMNSILHEAQTHASPADHIQAYVNFKGNFYGFFEEDYVGGSPTVMTPTMRVWNAGTDTWDAAATIITENEGTDNEKGGRVFDAIVHKSAIFVLTNNIDLAAADDQPNGVTSYVVRISTNASSFADTAGTHAHFAYRLIPTAVYRRNTPSDDYGRLLDMGNTLMVAMFEDSNAIHSSINQIRILYTVDSGANWVAGAIIPSGHGPKAFVRWRDPYSSPVGADIPVLVTAEGLYRVDADGTTFDLIYALDGNVNNGRWTAVGQDGGLIIGLGSGGRVVLYINPSGGVEVRGSGDPGDGLVAARRGHVNYVLTPSLPWYFLAYGGHASGEQASIFAVDYKWQTDPVTGKLFQAWHSMYLEANANIDLYVLGYSSADDSTPRLHFALEHASSAEMYHLEQPIDNELQSGVTHKRAVTSFIEFPEENGGDPHTPKNILRARVDAEDLSGTDAGEYIENEYGINKADWTNVSNLGYFVSGDKELLLGRTQQNVTGQTEAGSSTGIAAYSIRNKLIFNRDAGDNTQTPKVNEYELTIETKLPRKQGFQVVVDIGLTVEHEGGNEDDVRTNIDTVIDSVPLVSFQYPTDLATALLVRVDRYNANLETGPPGTNIDTERTGGTITLSIEERL
jgi:hypothetical protein